MINKIRINGTEHEIQDLHIRDELTALQKEIDECKKSVEEVEVIKQKSPMIGSNNNWFVWNYETKEWTDTGCHAVAEVPSVGVNGHWYVGTTDTGVMAKGADGISVIKIEQTETSPVDGGTNVIMLTLSNGQQYRLETKNGHGVKKVTFNQDYTMTIEFTDGTSYTSGSLRGAKGDPGYTPQKDVDYFDGVGIESVKQTTSASGSDGQNIITVTLTNGAKSTFIVKNGGKGEKGDAPVKGVDYWTLQDQEEVHTESLSYLASEIAKRSKVSPEFATSEQYLEEFGDTDKIYVLPNGHVYGYIATEIPDFDNKADSDSSEWLTDSRLNSSAKGTGCAGATVSNFIAIPQVAGTVIRVKGLDVTTYLENYKDSRPKQALLGANKVLMDSYHVLSLDKFVDAGILTYSVSGDVTTITMISTEFYYIRFVGTIMPGYTKDTVDIAVNEEFKYARGFSWQDSGVEFVSSENVSGRIEVEANLEFVESEEDCVDESKVYVLPDGKLWAFLKRAEWVIPEYSKDWADVTAEWVSNTRLSTNSTSASTGCYVTPYIKCAAGDIIYIKGLNIRDKADSRGRIHYCDANKAKISGDQNFTWQLPEPYVVRDGDVIAFKVGSYWTTSSSVGAISGFSYMRFCGPLMAGYTLDDVIITVNEPIVDEQLVERVTLTNTGIPFVPSDFSGDIYELKLSASDLETRIKILEQSKSSTGESIPDYWATHLSEKAEEIQVAMADAGRNKSAFLWYTDAHWTYSSKSSPKLLRYLIENTPMNKVNFGGDIVGDPNPYDHNNVKYVHLWRKAIAGIPNHHSVYGNHDLNHRTTDVSSTAYALVLASEESSDMVVGGDSYYYIDNPSEKTRYLYLSYFTNQTDEMKSQAAFITEALNSLKDGWHLVAIAHRWWQYAAVATPTIGTYAERVPTYEKSIISAFDAYNARTSLAKGGYFEAVDFKNAKGKVEFCIGGHIHVDHDFRSPGNIPIIITAADTNQERASDETEDSGTLKTTTESAVFGIIADYTHNIITVVGVGRGTPRVIELA